MQIEEPFRWRSYLLRRLNPAITADDLSRLWESQGGLCGLTGRPMDIQDADVDHIQPISRSGGSELSNLRWVCRRANEAKGNMTDEEFFALSKDVAEWIGRRLMAVANTDKGAS
jgi:5-methylcytosine-specific restriction endonuclease McrA